MMKILLCAIPIFIITMLIELRLSRGRDIKGYEAKDTAASLAMGIGNLFVMFGTKIFTFALYMAAYEYRIFEIPTDAWWVWIVLITADDFIYYWFHRAGHEIRLFWAAHVNHHSSEHYNLSTALRQSWTAPFLGWPFWIILPLLGFHPLMLGISQVINLLYQYWLHTELIDRMGRYQLVFVTPSHHRVHHGSNPQYLDRNHGGIFIIWDRLFGTFEPETTRPTYGLTTNLESYNIFVIAFHEWAAIARDLFAAESWRGRLGYLFGPPGWREDGQGVTSRMIREQEAWIACPDVQT